MILFKFDYAGQRLTGTYSHKTGEVYISDGTSFTFSGPFRMAIKDKYPGAVNIEVVT